MPSMPHDYYDEIRLPDVTHAADKDDVTDYIAEGKYIFFLYFTA